MPIDGSALGNRQQAVDASQQVGQLCRFSWEIALKLYIAAVLDRFAMSTVHQTTLITRPQIRYAYDRNKMFVCWLFHFKPFSTLASPLQACRYNYV